jgi:hypothetical protein
MTTEERIATLENELADLRLRDARREAEHVALLESYTALAASRDDLRRDFETMEQTFSLTMQGVDERLAEQGVARRAETTQIVYRILIDGLRSATPGH